MVIRTSADLDRVNNLGADWVVILFNNVGLITGRYGDVYFERRN